jgi:hypothetical protein
MIKIKVVKNSPKNKYKFHFKNKKIKCNNKFKG